MKNLEKTETIIRDLVLRLKELTFGCVLSKECIGSSEKDGVIESFKWTETFVVDNYDLIDNEIHIKEIGKDNCHSEETLVKDKVSTHYEVIGHPITKEAVEETLFKCEKYTRKEVQSLISKLSMFWKYGKDLKSQDKETINHIYKLLK